MIGIQKGSTKGLMAFWATIEAEHEMPFLEWHNTEHIPERVAIPGFMLGRRYRVATNTSRFLMCYDTTDSGVLVSDAYVAALNHPTPKTRQSLAWFRNPLRNLYNLADEWGDAGPTATPVLVTIRIDAEAERSLPSAERGIAEVFAAAARSALSSDPVRAAVYSVEAASAAVKTNERAIHGAVAEEGGLLVWIEVDDLKLIDDPAYRDAFRKAITQPLSDGWPNRSLEFELAWLDFVDRPVRP